MKHFFTLLLLAGLLSTANAKTYYFSASGDDSRSATQAQNQSTPWKSIAKLNAVFSTLQPGDQVLFKRGETFYGSIIVNKSGSVSAPIVIGAYGSGDKPVIAGFLTISKWTSIGNGKYESSNTTLGSNVNSVSVNGALKEMGRYPNSNAVDKGYLYFESHGTNSITDNELPSSPDWTGAEVVIRTRHWVLDRAKVTDQSGRTIKYSPGATYTPYDDYGYFFQNDLRTLDQISEWYYNPNDHKFYMYFGTSSPSNYKVQVSAVDDLIHVDDYDNITFDNLSLQGANAKAVSIYSADNIHVQNCDMLSSGIYGAWAQNTNGLRIENCTVYNTNNTGIFLYSNTNGSVVRNNIVNNSGVFAGMAQNGDNQSSGIRVNGNNNTVEYNRIDSTGYCAIRFTGDNITIKNNFITNFNFIRDDGGGIYTSNSGSTDNVNRNIIGNIILNGIGAKEGTPNKVVQTSSGIYIDNNSSGINISGNTIANCGKVGLYIHNCYKVTITDNTCYNNTSQSLLNHDSQLHPTLRNIIFRHNVLVSKTVDQKVAMFYTRDNDISSFGKVDSNYYARPIDDNVTLEEITGLYISDVQVKTKHTLSTWKSKYSMYDKNTKKAPQTFDSTLNPDNFIRFEYNASTTSKTISLSSSYVDAQGQSYSGSVTLAPYSSIVLIKLKASALAVAVTSPTQSATYKATADVNLEASATTPSGTISKVLFYNGSTLLNTQYYAPYSHTWQNVGAGTYTITAKAYDNNGKVVTSAPVTFTVKKTSTTSAASNTEAATEETAVAQKSAVQQSLFDFQLYPNPATTRISVTLNGTSLAANAVLTVQDLSGKIVQRRSINATDNRIDVDLSSLSSGSYIISIAAGNNVISHKFLKAS